MSEPEELAPGSGDIRPLVASKPTGSGVWLFGASLALGAGLLFYSLESRREAVTAPSLARMADEDAGFIAAPPNLDIPQNYIGSDYRTAQLPYGSSPIERLPVDPPSDRGRQGARSRVATPPSAYVPSGPQAYSPESYPAPQVPALGPAIAIRQEALEPPETPGEADGSSRGKERVEATRFANPATTVPKGTVIQAVLETALDTTKAGFARAIISRDVYSFDGGKVLIPRGSRIIGEYRADAALGQKRVLIQWQRLMRPDGIMINMDSPSADPLGRAGIKGKVNSHFFQRFAGAILQSGLDIGTQLATREASRNTYILGIPSITRGADIVPEKIPPTIKVRQGSSVSVFVARDLDFTKVS